MKGFVCNSCEDVRKLPSCSQRRTAWALVADYSQQANVMVSSGVITITGGNIAACDICSPLKQTKQGLIR
jgi:hypothetical protein